MPLIGPEFMASDGPQRRPEPTYRISDGELMSRSTEDRCDVLRVARWREQYFALVERHLREAKATYLDGGHRDAATQYNRAAQMLDAAEPVSGPFDWTEQSSPRSRRAGETVRQELLRRALIGAVESYAATAQSDPQDFGTAAYFARRAAAYDTADDPWARRADEYLGAFEQWATSLPFDDEATARVELFTVMEPVLAAGSASGRQVSSIAGVRVGLPSIHAGLRGCELAPRLLAIMAHGSCPPATHRIRGEHLRHTDEIVEAYSNIYGSGRQLPALQALDVADKLSGHQAMLVLTNQDDALFIRQWRGTIFVVSPARASIGSSVVVNTLSQATESLKAHNEWHIQIVDLQEARAFGIDECNRASLLLDRIDRSKGPRLRSQRKEVSPVLKQIASALRTPAGIPQDIAQALEVASLFVRSLGNPGRRSTVSSSFVAAAAGYADLSFRPAGVAPTQSRERPIQLIFLSRGAPVLGFPAANVQVYLDMEKLEPVAAPRAGELLGIVTLNAAALPTARAKLQSLPSIAEQTRGLRGPEV